MTDSMKPRFCSECGSQLLPGARFCQDCGAAPGRPSPSSDIRESLPPYLRWGVPVAGIGALIVVAAFRVGSTGPAPEQMSGVPLSSGAMAAPDISAMSPSERADRLFSRVMRLWSDGKTDSAAFFAPMAISAFEAISPMTAHTRYDMGLVALVSGDLAKAAAQSESILRERPTHLLGLSLAARVADARGDAAAGRAFRQRMIAAEQSERAAGLAEYTDHDADLRAAIDSARGPAIDLK